MNKPQRFPQGRPSPISAQGQVRQPNQPRSTVQPKIATTQQKHPVAPPVYRPQSVPRVLQRKMATQPPAAQAKPTAPPAYRPQPTPKVLQAKTARNQPPQAKQGRIVAPLVYRPQPAPKALQTKKAAADNSTPHLNRTPVAPPVYRPQPAPKVLQRKSAVAPPSKPSNQPKHSPPAPALYHPQRNRIVQPKAAVAGQTSKAHTGIIQRMILVPFNNPDQELVDFARHRTGGIAPGPVVIGTQVPNKIGVNEKLVLVGHGNGTNFYSHEKPNNPNFKLYDFDDLATYLSDNVLPDNYNGEIVLWSCDSAKPWKHIPALVKQYGEGADELDNSFIEQLEGHLGLKKKGYKPTIYGAIGYVTLDRTWQQAEIYADETLKYIGEKKNVQHGFVKAGDPIDSKFYDLDDEEEEDYIEDASSSSVVTTATQPQQPTLNLPQAIPTFTSKEQYLEYLTSLAPSGSSSKPRSLKERLRYLDEKK